MKKRRENILLRMFGKKAIFLAFLLSSIFLMPNKAEAAAINWIGPAFGYWTSSTNWDSGTVPTAADDVTISSTTDIFGYTVRIPSGTTAQFNTLTIATSTLELYGDIDGGSMSISGNTDITQYNNHQQYLSGDFVGNGGTLRTGTNTSTQSYIFFLRANNIYVTSTGMTGRGYEGGQTSGANGNGPGYGLGSAAFGGGGGGNGGPGGMSSGGTNGGMAVCDPLFPQQGSGGGAGGAGTGGRGGGLFILKAVNTSTFDSIFAFNDGFSGSGSSGGGAGGTFLITSKNIVSTGVTLAVRGDVGGASGGGGGGGGCVVIRYQGVNGLSTAGLLTGGAGGGGGSSGTGGIQYNYLATVFPVLPPTSTDQVTTNSVRYNWIPGEGAETSYKLDLSTDGTSFNNVAMPAAPSSSYTFSGLSPNVRYWLRVASYDGATTSPYINSAPVYTLATIANAPVLGAVTGSSVQLSFLDDGNSTSTSYAIYVTPDNKYVTAAGALTTSPTYFTTSTWTGTVTGLTPSTSYNFGFIARNSGGINAATSTLTSTTTPGPIVPNAPTSTPSNPTTSSIKITIENDNNPTSTTYAIYNQTTGQYVTASGTPTTTAVFFSSSTWNNGFVLSLSLNTSYQFILAAKSTDNIVVSSSVSAPLYTLANPALAPTVTVGSTSTLNLVINTNGNPATTQYAVYNTSTNNYVTATGTSSATPVFFPSSTWGGVVNGLSMNTPYQLAVIARNGDSVQAASSSLNTAVYTLVNPALAPTVDTPTVNSLHIALNTNGNTSTAEYAIYNATSGMYVGTGGVPSATAVFYTSSTWSTITALSLLSNTSYQFSVISRNSAGTNSATSSLSIATSTLPFTPIAPTAPTLSNPTASSIKVTINTNGNTATTTYAIRNATTGNYVDSAGAPTSSPVYYTSSTWNNGFATGLALDTAYQFVVIAKSIDAFTTNSPTSTALYTLANPALAPTVTVGSTSTLNLVINTNGNPATTQYAVYNTSTSNYVTAAGTSSATPVFFTSSTWGGVVNGLLVNTPYQFSVISRNGDTVAAASSTLNAAVYTLANPASPVTVTSTGTSTLTMQFGMNGNPATTTFAIFNATLLSYLNSSGAATSSAFFQPAASWGAYVTSTGLSPNTSYQFGVVARNGANQTAATTTATPVYTFASVPTGLTSTARTASSITLTWSGDGTQYYAENMSNSTNSGWVSGTSFNFTGLTCNGGYQFRVKARNGDALETAFSTTTILLSDACSSGSGGGIVGVPAGTVTSGGSFGGGSSGASTPTTMPSSSLPVASNTGGRTIDSLFPGFGSGVVRQNSNQPETKIVPTITFFNIPVSDLRLGSILRFNYTVTNTSTVSRRVRVERTLINNKGQVITRSRISLNQKPNQVFSSAPKMITSRSLPVGIYTISVKVYSQAGKVLAQDSFSVSFKR